jgi:hypothetical protein
MGKQRLEYQRGTAGRQAAALWQGTAMIEPTTSAAVKEATRLIEIAEAKVTRAAS